ncbi:metabotropic glutamate receptor 7-like [Plectropomus leopardus]|uniref:metabotropic glutamate receptor 7-like n=1 Tax=Plectropomus leopardus TaxID=160734 RepID=UPI001C4D8CC5|nr:metabotropic glutamate receptor 7-like [Plectropomus leopardus]
MACTMARALHKMQRDLYPQNSSTCPEMDPTGGRKLLSYIRSVSFNVRCSCWQHRAASSPPQRRVSTHGPSTRLLL